MSIVEVDEAIHDEGRIYIFVQENEISECFDQKKLSNAPSPIAKLWITNNSQRLPSSTIDAEE